MPTPVSTARECLTDEAARALDDAVAVARRRSHTQTTSLHAVSALLSLPTSTLREACTRARSCAYSPRLQFRALELSVGVSLDRLPSAKTLEDEPPPPISNSLMAAIKRSQANQRRHPETFHMYQQAQNQFSLSSVKVELKHFVLSILDDPIVSRVFGEAGFRSTDIKIAILHPPTPISRFSRNRCPPPLFLCNLPDSDPKERGFNFPFAVENDDANVGRIAEVLVKKTRRNPLLIGFCAKEELKGFRECVDSGKSKVLPDGLSLYCIDEEISEFVCKDGSEERMAFKFKELDDVVKRCTGCGIIVNFGELEAIVNGISVDAVNYVVSRLGNLVKVHGEKLWLIGYAEGYETYMKFVDRFTSVEKDWDLHLLLITSSTPPKGGQFSKSSLMGSFVPFGGFFPTPSEFKDLVSSKTQSISCCELCNAKYEEEVSVILKGGSTISVAEQHVHSLSSCLQKDESDMCKSTSSVEARDDGVLNVRLMGLQRKWNDICQRLHHSQTFQQGKSQVRFTAPVAGRCHSDANSKESKSKDHIPNENICTDLSSCMHLNLSKIDPSRQNAKMPTVSHAEIPSFHQKVSIEVSRKWQLEMKNPKDTSYASCSLRIPSGLTSSSSIMSSVTTDLGLGTLYASSELEHRSPKFQDSTGSLLKVSASVPAEIGGISKNASQNHIVPTSTYHGDGKDLKYIRKVLSDAVDWQEEAVCIISETISSCRNGHGRFRGPTQHGDIWLSFLGPDKVGKRRIAGALAEINQGDLLSVNLNPEDWITHPNSIFDSQDSKGYSLNSRGKTAVGYIAEMLRRRPHSVVLLENIDKADFITQHSLTQAIKTGRFPDSNGREISINNVIFVTTSSTDQHFESGKGTSEFSEERVLSAKCLRMEIIVESVSMDMARNNGSGVSLKPMKGTSNQISVNKRKSIGTFCQRGQKLSRTCIDLNLLVEETEEGDDYEISESDSSSESSEVWLEDFMDQVDQKVVFKPFDFDKQAKKILKDIETIFRKTIGPDVLLDIDLEVIVQILAAAWLSNNKRAVEDWVKHILHKSFVEAQQKHHVTTQSIVKLVALDEVLMEEKAISVCLPKNIIVN